MKQYLSYLFGWGIILLTILVITPAVHATISVVPRTQEQKLCSTESSASMSAEVQQIYTKEAVVVYNSPTPTPPPTVVKQQVLAAKTSQSTDKPPSLNTDVIFNMINNYRASVGLPAFQKEDRLCELARERGPELYNEIFGTGTIHGGFYARNIPFWITENMKYGGSEQSVFDWWMGSTIHRKAIDSNFLYSCGECYGNSCVQLFTSYVPK